VDDFKSWLCVEVKKRIAQNFEGCTYSHISERTGLTQTKLQHVKNFNIAYLHLEDLLCAARRLGMRVSDGLTESGGFTITVER